MRTDRALAVTATVTKPALTKAQRDFPLEVKGNTERGTYAAMCRACRVTLFEYHNNERDIFDKYTKLRDAHIELPEHAYNWTLWKLGE